MSAGNPLVTMMYINGAWVDVTDRVTVDQTQPMLTASNMIVNQVLPLGASPYQNMNSTIGEITTLPTWGDWGVGGAYCWFPWDWASQSFNNTFAPHESRLIVINNTQATGNLAALESGNIALYASASNYINNQPVNGTYLNTVSTATQVKQLQLQQTDNGYLYNAILADNQTFQPGQLSLGSNCCTEDRAVTNVNAEELEGTTLNVYTYVVKEGKSVGPREVMRATNLTSPSVAHWHLQKLEGLRLASEN